MLGNVIKYIDDECTAFSFIKPVQMVDPYGYAMRAMVGEFQFLSQWEILYAYLKTMCVWKCTL